MSESRAYAVDRLFQDALAAGVAADIKPRFTESFP
jgi:hypothetical protein